VHLICDDCEDDQVLPQVMTLTVAADIPNWVNAWNKDPKPFVWTRTASEILDTLAAYCRRIKDSGH
jgi:hypothetical protein